MLVGIAQRVFRAPLHILFQGRNGLGETGHAGIVKQPAQGDRLVDITCAIAKNARLALLVFHQGEYRQHLLHVGRRIFRVGMAG